MNRAELLREAGMTFVRVHAAYRLLPVGPRYDYARDAVYFAAST